MQRTKGKNVIHAYDCECSSCRTGKTRYKDKRKKKKKKKKKNKQKRTNYKSYIKSKKWQNKRDQFIKKVGNRCERCAESENLHVHHMHYGFVGREEQKHVAVLCSNCHFLFHERHKTSAKMIDETIAFIKEPVLEKDQKFICNL